MRPKERRKRIEYEQRRAIAEHFKRLSVEKSESSDTSGVQSDDSIPEGVKESAPA